MRTREATVLNIAWKRKWTLLAVIMISTALNVWAGTDIRERWPHMLVIHILYVVARVMAEKVWPTFFARLHRG